jgi:superfamily II DNA or RNA helicase
LLASISNIDTLLVPETKADDKALAALFKTIRADAPGAEYTWKYKCGEWDGKVNLLKKGPKGVFCPTGYLPTASTFLKSQNIHLAIEDRRELPTVEFQETTVPLRDYQWQACASLFQNMEFGYWWPRGVVRIATGGGKTEAAAAMVQMAALPTLFLVHRKDLLHQAHERFMKYGLGSTIVGDSVFDLSGDVVVGTVQTISKRVKDECPDTLKMLRSREFLIVDEAHGIAASVDKGNQFSSVLRLCDKAYMRMGLTATPFMRDKYSNQLLSGATGRELISIPTRQLIDGGWLSDASVKMVNMPSLPSAMWKKEPGEKSSRFQKAYTSAIELYDNRNERILDELNLLPGPNLILVKTIAHGEVLLQRAKNRGINLPFIHGKMSRIERKEAIDVLVRTNGNLMTTGIFDEGIDIPSLSGLILASGGKSQGRSLQRIGRGLRKWAGKDGLKVVDFYDKSQPLKAHSEGRLQLWRSEGYTVEQV